MLSSKVSNINTCSLLLKWKAQAKNSQIFQHVKEAGPVSEVGLEMKHDISHALIQVQIQIKHQHSALC
jgi:hypothetical protein